MTSNTLPTNRETLNHELHTLERDLIDLNLHYKHLLSQQSDLLASGVHDLENVNMLLRRTSLMLNEKSERLY
jgi:hypothetical protein